MVVLTETHVVPVLLLPGWALARNAVGQEDLFWPQRMSLLTVTGTTWVITTRTSRGTSVTDASLPAKCLPGFGTVADFENKGHSVTVLYRSSVWSKGNQQVRLLTIEVIVITIVIVIGHLTVPSPKDRVFFEH